MEERDRSVLQRLDGVDAGRVISMPETSFQIGRHPTNRVAVSDRGVSRVHARVYHQDGVDWIEDLGSRNGTFVQGRRLDHCSLEDGDTVQLGPRVSFRYSRVDSRQEQLQRQMFESSTRDGLTGVYNRRHFTERLTAEIAHARRHGGPTAVVLFDIDHFKRVNDTYGHPVGDAVLRHVAAIISQRVRTEEVLARYGGEEFIALLRQADVKAAFQMAERMRVAISTTPAFVDGECIPVSVSAGCAALDCASDPTPEALIEVADRRLYAAKRAGRNRVVFSD